MYLSITKYYLVIKNIRYMHADLTNQIVNILYFNKKVLYSMSNVYIL